MASTFHPADPRRCDRSSVPAPVEVARIRRDASTRFRRLSRVLWRALAAGLAAATSVWFLARPIDRDANLVSASLAVGLATFFVIGMMGRILIPRPPALCPQCGCDWYRESNNDMHQWLTWQNCPGCGLQLEESAGTHQSRNASS